MKQACSVTLLGIRGSVPVEGDAYRHCGQGTTCILVRLAGQPVVVDAGTGILRLEEALDPEERDLPLLLTHAHADHLMGFGLCPLLFQKTTRMQVYGRTRAGLTAEDQLRRFLSPPLWPVGPELLPAEIGFQELGETLTLGPVTVQTLEGAHPGGVSLLRLTGGGKTVVVMTDCTLTVPVRDRFLDFARDCDLLLVDGQYSPEEWPTRSTFGHSTWEQAAAFGQDCRAGQVRIIHHDPGHTDAVLLRAEAALTARYPQCRFGRGGEEIPL